MPASNFSAITWSVRNGESKVTLSISVALDNATYAKPLVNGLSNDGSYAIQKIAVAFFDTKKESK